MDQEQGEALDHIISSYSRADDVLEGVKFLRPILGSGQHATSSNGNGVGHSSSSSEQDPVYYEELQQLVSGRRSSAAGGSGAADALPIAFAQRRPQAQQNGRWTGQAHGEADSVVRVVPPASANQREFTMLRLLDVTDAVMQKLLSPDGLDLRYEDVLFR